MKRKLLITSALLSLVLVGCGSSVSLEDYNTLQSNYYSLQNDYDSLKNKYDSLENDYDSLKNNYDELSNSIIDITEDIPTQNKIFSDSYTKASAWVSVAFGDNAKYCELGNIGHKAGNILQVYVPTDYSSSDAKKAFDDVKSSIISLSLCDLKYDFISIKFLYPDSTELIDIGLSLNNDSYGLSYISGDLMNSIDIVNSLK